MEIPKSLQEEIQSLQNELKNAIQNHQIYVGKLNDDPNNEELLGQIHEIQEHIISLSKCQKQVVQRLRKEVKLYEAANSNGTKVSIASLLGLNNNNNITNKNDTRTSDSKQTLKRNNLNGFSRRSSKDDYEDGIRNVDISMPDNNCQDNCAKARRVSEETDSNEEDVIEIAIGDNSIAKLNGDEIYEIQLFNQLDFLGCLGLITSDKHTELQKKRAERKRRSTANPQFVYSNWEIPTKRKRHSYLQSNGTAPQTRQTTARLNGPSPPPNKVAGNKPSPPPPKASVKSLIPTQKSSTRPNILRNNPESKVYAGKIKSENGLSQAQTSISVKTAQSLGSKAVHIPGLPSSLTIERIENDASAVCIHCRNPGFLTVCEICAAYFHVSCHVIESAPLRTCPKCLTKTQEEGNSDALIANCKEEDEIATTSNASGTVGEAGEDSEVHKTSRGFHKVDEAEERPVSAAVGINQLPSSTFLIPIAPNSAIPSSSNSSAIVGQSESNVSTSASISGESNVSTPYSSILLKQLSKSTRGQSDARASYAYQLPVSGAQQEKSQSYLILKKISDSSARTGRSKPLSSSIVAGNQSEKRSSSSIFDYRQSSSTGYNDHDQSEIRSIPAASNNDCSQPTCGHFSGKFKFNGKAFDGAEDTTAEPIVGGKSESATKTFNGDQGLGKFHSKLSINELRPSKQSNAFIPLHSIIDDAETLGQFDVSKQSESEGKVGRFLPGAPGGKGESKSNLLHSLFPSNNEPHSFPGCVIQPENPSSEQIQSEFNLRSHEDRQSDYDARDGQGPRLQYSSSRNIGEHVKLEEAHLPAPLRPNVVRKSVDDIDAILEKKEDSNPLPDAKCDNFTDVESKSDGSLTSGSKDDANSDFMSFEDYHNENLRATLDFIAIERKHSSTYIKFYDFEKCGNLRKKDSAKVRRRDLKPPVSSCASELPQKNLPGLRNKQLLPPEIKAEFERQDLPINDSQLRKREETITQDKFTAALSQECKTKLGINAVSTENMQVLEQFESAMLQVDEDQTANC